ncbi:MAG: hypothetical protein SGPRY_012584 [Prymnesium sp.]
MRGIRQAIPDSDKSSTLACALLRLSQSGAEATSKDPSEDDKRLARAVVTPVGSRLTQSLLALPSGLSEPLIQSLASLSTASLLELCTSPLGSRVIEAALKADGANQPRAKLRKAMLAECPRLARDKLGSFVVEAAFDSSAVDDKCKLMEVWRLPVAKPPLSLGSSEPTPSQALAPVEASLRSSTHGAFLLKKAFAELLGEEEPSRRGATLQPSRESGRKRGGAVDLTGGFEKAHAQRGAAAGSKLAHEEQEILPPLPSLLASTRLSYLYLNPSTRLASAGMGRKKRKAATQSEPKGRARKEAKSGGGSSSWLSAALTGGVSTKPLATKRKFSMT